MNFSLNYSIKYFKNNNCYYKCRTLQSKAPVNQLVNADGTSVIDIKTATDTSLKAKRNYIFARLCNEKQPFLYYKNNCKLIPYSLIKVILMHQ